MYAQGSDGVLDKLVGYIKLTGGPYDHLPAEFLIGSSNWLIRASASMEWRSLSAVKSNLLVNWLGAALVAFFSRAFLSRWT